MSFDKRDLIWQRWVFPESLPPTIEFAADWHPSAGELTVTAWDAWQRQPQMKRIRRQDGSYEDVSAAELAKREAAERWRQAQTRLIASNRQRALNLRRKIATRKAEELLLSMLDEGQEAEWREGKHFHIETADGQRRYRIRHGRAGNVYLVKDGDRVAPPNGHLRRFCMHIYEPPECGGRVPDEDNCLAQKLLLETNEAEFLRLANVS